MTPIKLQHPVAASIVTFTAATLFSTTIALGGDVYFGSFDQEGGQWALVNNTDDEPVGFRFIGFIPSRRQLIVGSPYYYDVVGGRFWEFGRYEGEILANGQVKGTVSLSGESRSLENLSFSGAIDTSDGSFSRFTGSWDDSGGYAFVGPTGKAMVFMYDQGGADCGVGSIDNDGNLKLSFAFGSRSIWRIDPVARKLVGYFPVAKKDAPSPGRSTSRLVNFSVRANLVSVPARLTAEFVVRGSEKPALIRAVGPGLRPFLSANALADDPRLAVYGGSALLASNENWDSTPALAAAFEAAGAFPLASGSKDAAILTNLDEYNVAYFTSTTAGVGLLEVFDLGSNDDAHFARIAVFHLAGGSAGDLVAGFVIAGTSLKTVLLRGLGPALAPPGFPDERVDHGDPTVSVHRDDGSSVAMNGDWTSNLAAVFQQVGASPLRPGSKDAALQVELPPGAYTVVLRSTQSRPLLLEIFEVQ